MIQVKELYEIQKDIKDLKENGTGATPEQLAQIEKNKVDIINMNQNISNHEKDWRDLGILDTKITARQKTRIPSALGSAEYVKGYVSKPFIHEGKIYISESSTYETTNGLISYDPSTDTWEKASFSLPFKPHSDGYGIAINEDIIHGIQRGSHITYNIKTGETKTHTIENDIYHTWDDVVFANNKLYGVSDDDLAEYDLATKTAKILKAIPQDSNYVQAGYILHDKNKLYIFSNARAKYHSYIYEYDILTTNLRKVAFTDRAYHLPAINDGDIILTGSVYDNSSPHPQITRVNILTGVVTKDANALPIDMYASATFNVDGMITAIDPMNGNVVSISSAKPPTTVKQVRANATELSNYVGVRGQIIVDTDDNSLVVMDGTTKGGHKLATNARVEEVFQSVSNGKELIETAITDKGGTVSKENQVATFGELSNGIHSIQGEDLVGKQLMLDVIIGKLPALDGVLTIDSPLSEYANYMFGIGPMNTIAKDTVANGRYSMSKRQVHYTPTNITEIVTTNLVAPITKPFSEVADIKSSKMTTRKCKVVSLGLSDDAIIEFIEEKKWRVDYDDGKSNHRNI